MKYRLKYSLENTAETAQDIFKIVSPESRIFTFRGELGAGKTTLIKAFAEHLGVKDSMSSPTFSLINVYQGKEHSINHMDLYRLETIDEVWDLGMEELLYGEDYCFIEWPEIIENFLPEEAVKIEIEILGKFTRMLLIEYPDRENL